MGIVCFLPSAAFETLDKVDMRINTRRNHMCGGNVKIIAGRSVGVYVYFLITSESLEHWLLSIGPRFRTCPSSRIMKNTKGHNVSEIGFRLALFNGSNRVDGVRRSVVG
jgi:hypothetical protein